MSERLGVAAGRPRDQPPATLNAGGLSGDLNQEPLRTDQ
jgi:hypothetical protein